MRIEVVADSSIDQQARTYAEYRLFAALTQLSETVNVRWVRAVLREEQFSKDCPGVACMVTVQLRGSDSIRIRTIGSHAYAAINDAVDRLRTSRQTPTEDCVSI